MNQAVVCWWRLSSSCLTLFKNQLFNLEGRGDPTDQSTPYLLEKFSAEHLDQHPSTNNLLTFQTADSTLYHRAETCNSPLLLNYSFRVFSPVQMLHRHFLFFFFFFEKSGGETDEEWVTGSPLITPCVSLLTVFWWSCFSNFIKTVVLTRCLGDDRVTFALKHPVAQ